jgi:superfamily II DNA or RNA helicase
MTFVPRDYQQQALDAVFRDFDRFWSSLIVMATGAGKTCIYIKTAERFLKENPESKVMVIAHREELIMQPARSWRNEFEEWPLIEKANLRADAEEYDELYDSSPVNHRIIIASIPTLNSGRRCRACTAQCKDCAGQRRTGKECEDCRGECKDYRGEDCQKCGGTGTVMNKCKTCSGDGWVAVKEDCGSCFENKDCRMLKFGKSQIGLLIVDEAHHSPAPTYTRIIRYLRKCNPAMKVLGLTATPDRADEEELGQVYQSVACEYSLPQPILDGWLVPVQQQFVMVEDLNLSNVRKLADDLNQGDLEREMMQEKVIHKVTTPLVEISCGMETGTIDRLISENQMPSLEDFVKERRPTLVHCVDVAHAHRTTEVINRYLPDSALCITGDTDKTIRRDGLKAFAEGRIQFLLSCGVFLEGTDLPNVAVVGVARPTRSRALYAQMAGRGLRPEPGCIDGIQDPEERVAAIVASSKPHCTIIDFVGNSGKHKLICSVDILGNSLPDELVNGVVRKMTNVGKAVDVMESLEKAQEEERQRRHHEMQKASEATKQEEMVRRQAAERRQGIVAGASYTSRQVDPFDVLDIAPTREPAWARNKPANDQQKEKLRKFKIPFDQDIGYWPAKQLLDEAYWRIKHGMCSYKQAQTLMKYGYDPANVSFKEASAIIDSMAKNHWRRPVEDFPRIAAHYGYKIICENGSPHLVRVNDEQRQMDGKLLGEFRQRRDEIVAYVSSHGG